VLKRAPPPHRANLKAEPSAAVSAWRILLVEDNPVNQRVATALLKKMGHQVRVANHGQEAINLILSDPPDLVLMDVEMPEMDGLEATRRIRALEQARGDGPRLPIIALTAHAMKGHREQFLAAGMDAYASKPIRSAELHAAIAAAMAAAAR
jgi:CheY-like chemotaxis protein